MTALEKPVVETPTGTPPTDLVLEDLTVGEGDEARAGQTVTVHYVGVAFSNGKEFDASWNRREPFQFRLGASPPRRRRRSTSQASRP